MHHLLTAEKPLLYISLSIHIYIYIRRPLLDRGIRLWCGGYLEVSPPCIPPPGAPNLSKRERKASSFFYHAYCAYSVRCDC